MIGVKGGGTHSQEEKWHRNRGWRRGGTITVTIQEEAHDLTSIWLTWMRRLLWTLWRTTRSCTTKLMRIPRTKQQGRSCLLRCQDLVWVTEDTLRQTDANKGWTSYKGDDGTSELDTGLLRSHIRCKGLSKSSGSRSQCFSCLARDISRASTDADSIDISI